QFPGGSAWEGEDEGDGAGDFEGGEVAADQAGEFIREGGSLLGGRDDEGTQAGGAAGVWGGGDRGLSDAGVAGEQVLDVGGCDVDTAYDFDVVHPAGVHEAAVGPADAGVTGGQPARLQCRGGGLGAVQIFGEQSRSADVQ